MARGPSAWASEVRKLEGFAAMRGKKLSAVTNGTCLALPGRVRLSPCPREQATRDTAAGSAKKAKINASARDSAASASRSSTFASAKTASCTANPVATPATTKPPTKPGPPGGAEGLVIEPLLSAPALGVSSKIDYGCARQPDAGEVVPSPVARAGDKLLSSPAGAGATSHSRG